jgi:ligand-binding sensor domain-containing protein
VWASTEGGLSRIQDGRVITLNSANGLECDGVHWTVEDKAHFFWLYTPCGMVRVARRELDAWATQPNRAIETTVLGPSDGVRPIALLAGYTPRVSQSADGPILVCTPG